MLRLKRRLEGGSLRESAEGGRGGESISTDKFVWRVIVEERVLT